MIRNTQSHPPTSAGSRGLSSSEAQMLLSGKKEKETRTGCICNLNYWNSCLLVSQSNPSPFARWEARNIFNRGTTLTSAGKQTRDWEGGSAADHPKQVCPCPALLGFKQKLSPTPPPSSHVKPCQEDLFPSVSTLPSTSLPWHLFLQHLQARCFTPAPRFPP